MPCLNNDSANRVLSGLERPLSERVPHKSETVLLVCESQQDG